MTEIKEAFDEIEKFHGNENENVEKWLQKVDGMCACFDNISDRDKLKRIPTKLGAEVFEWYNNNKTTITDWETFKQAITTKYPAMITKSHPLINVDNFNKRCKRDDETVAQYYHDKMELANKVDSRMVDALRVAALIDGLPSSLRIQLAYKKTEMSTPANFLTIVQMLEQEIELLSRETLEEQMARLSLKPLYPTEDRQVEQLVTTVSNNAHNQYARQRFNQQPNVNGQTSDKQPLQQQHSRTDLRVQSRNNADFAEQWATQTANDHQSRRTQRPFNTSHHQEQYGRMNGYDPARANYRTPGNASDRACYSCGKIGHISRFCQSRRLKE